MEGPSFVADWIKDHARLVEALTFRYYEILMGLAVIGALFTILHRRQTWIWPIVGLPFLLTFFHIFFHAKDRFHMPLVGVIALLAAVTLVEFARLVGRVRARRALPGSATTRA